MVTRLAAAALVIFAAPSARAHVDEMGGAFREDWVDVSVAGLTIVRSYDSQSSFVGEFGVGWCANFEVSLEIGVDDLVVDECGDAAVYRSADVATGTFVLVPRMHRTLSEVKPPDGGASDVQLITLRDGVYVRDRRDGTVERFDAAGRLIMISKAAHGDLKLIYDGGQLSVIQDDAGRKLIFQRDKAGLLTGIAGPNGEQIDYAFDGRQLAFVRGRSELDYIYDEDRKLVRIEAGRQIVSELSYNAGTGVVALLSEGDCQTAFSFPSQPGAGALSMFDSSYEKRCDGNRVQVARNMFTYQGSTAGETYLASRSRNVNGDLTRTDYHPVFGRPVSVNRNGIAVTFEYYEQGSDAGRVSIKQEPGRVTRYTYDPACHAVASVIEAKLVVDRLESDPDNRERRPPRAVEQATTFAYDALCRLVQAKAPDGVEWALEYDAHGLLARIADNAQRVVLVEYDAIHRKATRITQAGSGSIIITYNIQGEIASIDSAEGPVVAAGIAGVFNRLMEMMRPASANFSVLGK